MQTLRPTPIADLRPYAAGGELVAFDAAHDGSLYVAFALRPLDLRKIHPSGASSVKVRPARPQSYRVLAFRGAEPHLDVVLADEPFNIYYVQPLADQILLVCARCQRRSDSDCDRNGRLYTREGRPAGEILLGDGIQQVQTTASGTIWTSYFDEGIFGNYGWDEPLGASGLVAWDREGTRLYDFEPTGELGDMADCYALNVASESDVWCCYYTDFPLVHIQDRAIRESWSVPVKGSAAFAVAGDSVLFRGGYHAHDTYALCRLEPGGATLVREYTLVGPSGDPLKAERCVGRGSHLHLLSQGVAFRLSVEDAAASERGLP